MNYVPAHLRKYVMRQKSSDYTAEDHAVWRFIMKELTHFHYKNAHPAYRQGLKKTGVTLEQIPSISSIDRCLKKIGWRAVPVSGFIPPAAFLELQALCILPIAAEMRRIENLDYTPAPDIVHEAAGHAPMISYKPFSNYLKKYASVARKAIITQKDIDQYLAIRELSDLKEHPEASAEDIQKAYDKLEATTRAMDGVTEASKLSRMAWWTTEYGLIKIKSKPKIYGAGLLSSLGESQHCLSSNVKKIIFSVQCVEQSYDITKPQPQLFVARDFKDLEKGLEDLADQMAFRKGGVYGLQKMLEAKTVNTIELNSGLQISGHLESYKVSQKKDEQTSETAQKFSQLEFGDQPIFIKLSGPTQLCYQGQQLRGQGPDYHHHGYSTPLGLLKGEKKCLSEMSPKDWQRLGLIKNKNVRLVFESGIIVEGLLAKIIYSKKNTRKVIYNKKNNRRSLFFKPSAELKPLLFTFKNCTVTYGEKILFQPEWGAFDMALGSRVTSVYGGPADRAKYILAGAEAEDFHAVRLPKKRYTPAQKKVFSFYKKTALWRKTKKYNEKQLFALYKEVEQLEASGLTPNNLWLIYFEIYELARMKNEIKKITNKAAVKKDHSPSWLQGLPQQILKAVESQQKLLPYVKSALGRI